MPLRNGAFVVFSLTLILTGAGGCTRQRPVDEAKVPESSDVTLQGTVQRADREKAEVEAVESPARGDKNTNERGVYTRPDSPRSATTGYRATWAVIIGIDQYPGEDSELEPLQFAVNDAREVWNVLRDEFGYAESRIRFLTDKAATKAAIREVFEKWLVSQGLKDDDAVLVFFAGHGLIDRKSKEGYLAAVDSRKDALAESCVEVAWVRDRLKDMPCRHKLVILDSCYSGSLFAQKPMTSSPSGQISPSVGPQKQPDRPSEGQTSPARGDRRPVASGGTDKLSYYFQERFFWGMSAGRDTPVADGLGKEQHSVFTAALLRELRDRADTGRPDHAFTFRELASRVEARVREAPGSQQVPNSGPLAPGDGDFVFLPTARRQTPQDTARMKAYLNLIAMATQEWKDRDLGRASELLDQCLPELRHWEWHYLKRQCRDKLIAFPDACTPVAFSPDGQLLACGSVGDATLVTVWNTATGNRLLTFKGHRTRLNSLAFSPDGKRLASACGEFQPQSGPTIPGAIKVWDLITGQEILTISGQGKSTEGVVYSPEGKRLAAAVMNSTAAPEIKIWDATAGQEVLTIKGPHGYASKVGPYHKIHQIAFSPNGKLIAASGPAVDWCPTIWDAVSGKQFLVLEERFVPYHKAIQPVMFSQDGKRLFSTDEQGKIKAWTVAFDKVFTGPDGNLYAIPDEGRTARLVRLGQEAFTSPAKTGTWDDLSLSPDGKRVAKTTGNGVLVLDLATGEQVASYKTGSHAWKVIFSPDGSRVAVCGSSSGKDTLSLWSTVAGGEILGLNHGAFSPDGQRLVIGEQTTSAEIQDLRTGQSVKCQSMSGTVRSAAFSPDGKRVVVAGRDACVFDAATGQKVFDCLAENSEIESVCFAPDGKQILGVNWHYGDGKGGAVQVVVWDALSGQEQAVYRGRTPKLNMLFPSHGWAFSPDRALLALVCTDGVTIYRWTTAERVVVFRTFREDEPAGRSYCSVGFSPAGSRIAAGAKDGTITVWNIHTSKAVLSLRGHLDKVTSVAYSPDGKRLVSCSSDTMKMWDTSTGEVTFTSPGCSFATFSSDGFRIAARGVYDATPLEQKPTDSYNGPALEGIGPNASDNRDTQGGVEMVFGPARQFEGLMGGVHSLAVTVDGKMIIAGERGGMIRMWDLAGNGQPRQDIVKGTTDSLALAPSGKMFASGFRDGSVRLWNLSGTPLQELDAPDGRLNYGGALAFARDGKTLACCGPAGKVCLWDLTVQPKVVAPTNGVPLSFDFTVFGEGLKAEKSSAVVEGVGRLRIHTSDDRGFIAEKGTVRSGQNGRDHVIVTFVGGPRFVSSVTVNHLNGDAGGKLHIGLGTENHYIQSAKGGTFEINKLSDTISLIVPYQMGGYSLGKVTLRVEKAEAAQKPGGPQTASQRTLVTGFSRLVEALVFSLDGTMLVLGAPGEGKPDQPVDIQLWDTKTGKLQRGFQAHAGGIRAMALSPDGKTLATGSSDLMIKLWDMTRTDPPCKATLMGHAGPVLSVAFSPDGRRLLSGSEDHSIRLWDVQTGKNLACGQGHQKAVRCVAFLPDGVSVLSGSLDSTIRLWKLPQ